MWEKKTEWFSNFSRQTTTRLIQKRAYYVIICRVLLHVCLCRAAKRDVSSSTLVVTFKWNSALGSSWMTLNSGKWPSMATFDWLLATFSNLGNTFWLVTLQIFCFSSPGPRHWDFGVFGVASQALLCSLSNGLVQHTCECWTRPSSDETDASNSHDLRWWFKLALASDLTYSSQVSNNTHEKEWIFHVNGNF